MHYDLFYSIEIFTISHIVLLCFFHHHIGKFQISTLKDFKRQISL